MSTDMDQEIRDNAGDALNEATANTEGTKKWGEQESNTGGEADPKIEANADAGAPSTGDQIEGVHEAAQKAQAAFAGTADLPGAAGIVESDADGSTSGAAATEASSAPAESSHNADGESDGLGAVSGGFDAEEAAKHDKDSDDSEEDKQPGTGAMLAGILASDPSMKWESKIVAAFSDTDDVEEVSK